MQKFILFVVLSLVLAGCQSTPDASNNDYARFRLNQVVVDFTQTERPILVAELDAELSRSLATTAAGALGVRMGVNKQAERETAYLREIENTVKPHVTDALTPFMRGTHPLNAIVEVKSTFLRSRAGLTRLTGADVYIDGQKRPDKDQFIASIVLIDVESGVRFERIGPIAIRDDGAVTIWEQGPKAPNYGKGPRLNKLVFDFAQEAATRMKQRNVNPTLSAADLEALAGKDLEKLLAQ